jgi:GNAT superfamily N-acetyltransferase
MATFIPYDDGLHRAAFFTLTVEFLRWYVEQVFAWHQIDVEALTNQTVEDYAEHVLDDFTGIDPTQGILYLIMVDEQIVGMGALKQLEAGVGEIKRMFIRPAYRGRGYGKALLKHLMSFAQIVGYTCVRLETADFSTTAHHLYRAAGFTNIDKYPGGETPEWYRPYCLYMEKSLHLSEPRRPGSVL